MTGQELLEAARGLAPAIETARVEMDRERRITPSLLQALTDAGMFQLLVPRSLGGYELSLEEFVLVIEELAKADGSVAFCLAHACGASSVAGFLPEHVARQVFDGPGANVANGPGQGGRATHVDGGFRVTGQWGFASGSHHATWLGGGVTTYDMDGQVLRREDGSSEQYFFVWPARDASLTDIWDTIGLRGTGSDLISVEDLFVPAERAVPVPRRSPSEKGPLYLIPQQTMYGTAFAAVGMGLARGALDGFNAVAGKVSRNQTIAMRDNRAVQAEIGLAEAELLACRSGLFEAVRRAWDGAGRRGELNMDERAALRLATTYGIRKSATIVDTIYHQTGGAAVFTKDPLGQRFRDAHALTQQMQGRSDHYQTVGAFLLGLETESEFL
jgi:alkylation response protein AidB-like acyl-CoA dehydrogenase